MAIMAIIGKQQNGYALNKKTAIRIMSIPYIHPNTGRVISNPF